MFSKVEKEKEMWIRGMIRLDRVINEEYGREEEEVKEF